MHKRPAFDRTRVSHMPEPEATFVSALARYQDGAAIADKTFVASLGVSLALWRQTRSGGLPLGYKLLIAGADYVPARIYQGAEDSLTARMRVRLNGEPA